jgi:hypothetical protein
MTTKFPSGVTVQNYIYVLAKATDISGAISFAFTRIIVKTTGINVKDSLYAVDTFVR